MIEGHALDRRDHDPAGTPLRPVATPRLLTPAELALVVRGQRRLRGWSQDALATTARITVRTLQRVERGEPSDIQTRRGLARAFGAPDIDTFNRPSVFPTIEEAQERERQEREAFERDYAKLPAEPMDGRALVRLADECQAFQIDAAFVLPREAERLWAELTDYLRDLIDGELSAVDKLDFAGDLGDRLAELARLGVTVRGARRSCRVTFGTGAEASSMPLTVGYVVACPAGSEPREIAVSKRGPIRMA
jgi:transcriptional regulator with XRE-family HTH domain